MSAFERHFAVAVSGTQIVYECPNGHRYSVDHGKGAVSKRLPAWWCARMLRYWGRANGGVNCLPCKKCIRQKEAAMNINRLEG